MSPKEAIIEMIRRMPEEADFDDILEWVTVRTKIERSIRQLDAGEGISNEEFKKRMARWLSGPDEPDAVVQAD